MKIVMLAFARVATPIIRYGRTGVKPHIVNTKYKSISECCFAYRLSGNSIKGAFVLKDYIEERVLEIANYILENNCTVRMAAKKFEVSKSTVHKDVTERLKNINSVYYFRVKRILEKNKSERHIRGGMATKRKYDVIKHVRERMTEDYDI